MSDYQVSLDDVKRDVASSLEARYQIGLKFGDCRIRVKTNSSKVEDELNQYFRIFKQDTENFDIEIYAYQADPPAFDFDFTIKSPDPGKTKIKEEFVNLQNGRIVRKRLTGMTFMFGEGTNVGIGPCENNINQVVNFINNRYIQWMLNRGCLLCHAAGVNDGRHGLGLAGFSGMGKSTLAIRLVTDGLTFVSNDRLLIRQEHASTMMYGVAKHPRINPGTIINNRKLHEIMPEDELDQARELPQKELWELEQKYDALIDKLFGPERYSLQSRIDCFVILNWQLNAGPSVIRQVDLKARLDLLDAVMKSPGLFYEDGECLDKSELSPAAYLEMLSDVRTYEIGGGVDFEYASAKCRELLEYAED